MTGKARAIRNAGYVACLVGVLAMIAGRYRAGAPPWLVFVGLAVIALGWGLMAWAVLAGAARRLHGLDGSR